MKFALRLSAGAVLIALAGCATVSTHDNAESIATYSREHLGAEPKWLVSDEARREARVEVDRLLARALSADDAVRIALAHSPRVQVMFAELAGMSADSTQSTRLPNPVFAFERGVRREDGVREVEINRSLTASVLDLLFLPSRLRLNDYRQQRLQWQGASDIVQAAVDARHAWVRAVAARQALAYHEQVKQAADASAELARRMQAAGNFSALQRAREQAFYADAVTRLARAQHAARAEREALVRALGLDSAQAERLVLPDRLPDLPQAPRDERIVTQTALDERLDMRMARAELAFVARAQGLTRVASVVNGLELGVSRNSESGRPTQKGFELAAPLPLFDMGDAVREGARATYLAALNRSAQVAVDAASQVRETYSAYRTAYDIARYYRDEIVPLRKTISDENLLRYNGMFIGVFELLADAREQVTSVIQAIETQRDFWLADASLQANLLGRPIDFRMADAPTREAGSNGGH
ncbi:MAG TPA: TolC family protein [Burkholderiaceae bacterium]|nr:TolC family protein [Burkholderiaceae bacterium]